MEYRREVKLKDGRTCILRNGTYADGKAVKDNFDLTHEQTDWLLTYTDENSFDEQQESEFLQEKTESADEIEIVAEVGGEIVGTAGIECVGRKDKVRHRAVMGISVDKSCWSLGIGRALMEGCIECAKKAGYSQLELDVTAANDRAVELYKKFGFEEYGRNPRGFRSRYTGWQEILLMRLELD